MTLSPPQNNQTLIQLKRFVRSCIAVLRKVVASLPLQKSVEPLQR